VEFISYIIFFKTFKNNMQLTGVNSNTQSHPVYLQINRFDIFYHSSLHSCRAQNKGGTQWEIEQH